MDSTFNQQKSSRAFYQKPHYHTTLKLIGHQILAQNLKTFFVFSVSSLRSKET